MKWLTLAITVAVLGAQYFLSTRKHGAFGAILPILYSGLLAWFWLLAPSQQSPGPRLLVGLLVLLSIWAEGRSRIKKKQQTELDKMKLKDIA